MPAEWLTFVFSSAWIDPDEKRTAGLCAREICVLAVFGEIITVQILHVNENIDKNKDRDALILLHNAVVVPVQRIDLPQTARQGKRNNMFTGD
ncbi:MAG TPA: hypothetical protein PLQ77_08140 [Smithellaceae bacterium]|nr:hypothetical protein [Smithellaceae bacterium]HPL10687.1 hypothetical protein [Smithellaceae bacterium]